MEKKDRSADKRLQKAINELGAAGPGNDGYLVSFCNRICGIGPAHKADQEKATSMENFNDWFNNNLKVSGKPDFTVLDDDNLRVIINVSDSYHFEIHKYCMLSDIYHHWFPMNEVYGDMGLNSLYAALQALMYAESKNHSVLLHCQEGRNRSQTVADAYYFMRTGTHRFKRSDNINNIRLGIEPYYSLAESNNLIDNCEAGLLPPVGNMEILLRELARSCDFLNPFFLFGLDELKAATINVYDMERSKTSKPHIKY